MLAAWSSWEADKFFWFSGLWLYYSYELRASCRITSLMNGHLKRGIGENVMRVIGSGWVRWVSSHVQNLTWWDNIDVYRYRWRLIIEIDSFVVKSISQVICSKGILNFYFLEISVVRSHVEVKGVMTKHEPRVGLNFIHFTSANHPHHQRSHYLLMSVSKTSLGCFFRPCRCWGGPFVPLLWWGPLCTFRRGSEVAHFSSTHCDYRSSPSKCPPSGVGLIEISVHHIS